MGGPSSSEKICILWDRGGGGGGEDKGATGPAEKQVSAGVEQRNSPSEERGPASRLRTVNPETLRGTSLATSVPGISTKSAPRRAPAWLSPSGLSRLLNPALQGMMGVYCPMPLLLEKGNNRQDLCPLSTEAKKKKKKKAHQFESSGPGAFAPIFQKLTIEAPEKHPLPPPLLECLAGSRDPSATGNERRLGVGWGAQGWSPPPLSALGRGGGDTVVRCSASFLCLT